jgi:hypothetical protein
MWHGALVKICVAYYYTHITVHVEQYSRRHVPKQYHTVLINITMPCPQITPYHVMNSTTVPLTVPNHAMNRAHGTARGHQLALLHG